MAGFFVFARSIDLSFRLIVRLTHLRLAGFKSFVEPTSLAVPSKLVGVVGPNGCGKSNIIDAVRWVLGESKASELRGESMQDVIFNGSTHRKPASRASVELVFDNDQGRAGGAWNQYSEISVKRVLTRDGASTYYINQQAVRRRDVQDIFMGTGLGPRAYAIIGQGMIARLIEARPEELRVFLEEAAGVSKYKERRRETGNRLQDTRDNLLRVEDILRELGGQIERLEQQAQVARQYKALESEKSTKQKWLWCLRLREAEAQKNAGQAELARVRADLEQIQSRSVRAQTELFSLRQNLHGTQQTLECEQAKLIESNQTVSSLEADLRILKESRGRLQVRIEELTQELGVWLGRQSLAQQNATETQASLLECKDQAHECDIVLEEARLELEPVENALEQTRLKVELQQASVASLERESSAVASSQEAVRRNLIATQTKLTRLDFEKSQIAAPDSQELHALEQALKLKQHERDAAREVFEQLEEQFAQTTLALETQQLVFQTERDSHANTAARLSALTQLNEQLGKSEAIKPWTVRNGLQDHERVLSALEVQAGWEKAIESALRESVDAFRLQSLDALSDLPDPNPPERVAFFETQAASVSFSSGPEDLISMVSCADASLKHALMPLLFGAFVAQDLPNALRRRHTLAPGQRFYTPQGHSVSLQGVSLYAANDQQAGRLERKQQIEALGKEVRVQEMLKNESMQKRDALQAQCQQLKAELARSRQSFEDLTKSSHDHQLMALRLQEAQTRARARHEQIDLDLAVLRSEQEEHHAVALELDEQQAVLEERLILVRQDLASFRQHMAVHEQTLKNKQANVQSALNKKQDVAFLLQSQEARVLAFEKEAQFAQAQCKQVNDRKQLAQVELDGLSEVQVQQSLQIALNDRVKAQDDVSVARAQLEQLSVEVASLERQEKEADKLAQPLRDSLQALALKIQAAELAMDQFSSNLQEVQADLAAVGQELAALENVPKMPVLQTELTRLGQAMHSLGAVNLAALDELAAASDRKQFLDLQAADLREAMQTLENAIATIDRETRDLLLETFQMVNGHFSRLFPLLFGGGEARLVMTGDEILDAGMQVFAQPPGKKNGTIHLLSGGEKALTATALVFAIFELNPAPFCLLDEVDAPLDDANTERFSRLVKQMSEQTQFLFISHNKIAMEMAEQLIGVTMQEKGVSRIVAVDLSSAEKMAMETL